MRHRKFRSLTAQVILERLRRGETLSQIVKSRNMPDLLTFYDWLRNPRMKVGKLTLANAYQRALEDRAKTWRDQTVESLRDVAPADIRKVETRARVILAMAKDEGASPRTEKSRTVNVVIKKFPKPAG